MHELVKQYLIHYGHIETLNAIEVQEENVKPAVVEESKDEVMQDVEVRGDSLNFDLLK